MIDQFYISEYTTLQKQMVKDLSRPIIVGLPPLEEECPNCGYMDIDGSSLGEFVDFGSKTVFSGTECEKVITAIRFRRNCRVCSGTGKLVCSIEKTIPAMVNFKPSESMPNSLVDSPAGLNSQSIVRVKTDVFYKDYINTAQYFIIDGKKLEKIQVPHTRGMGNEIGVVVVFLGSIQAGSK